MTASQNVVLELKKLGIELDMPPNKLKSGYGEGVCQRLHSKAHDHLQRRCQILKVIEKENLLRKSRYLKHGQVNRKK